MRGSDMATNTDRFYLRLPDDMRTALTEEARRQNKTASALAREAIQAYLEQHGYKVTAQVKIGGDRRTSNAE